MKDYVKQIVDILKANNLTGITIDLRTNVVSEQYALDTDPVVPQEFNLENSIATIRNLLGDEVQQEDVEVSDGAPEGYCTVDAAMEQLHVTKGSVYKYINTNQLNHITVGGRYYIESSSLDALTRERSTDGLVSVKTLIDAHASRKTICSLIRRNDIKTKRIGKNYYVTPQEAEYLRHNVPNHEYNKEQQITIKEATKLMKMAPDTARRLFRDANISYTSVVIGRKCTHLYDRAKVMELCAEYRNYQNLGTYEIVLQDLMALMNAERYQVYRQLNGMAPTKYIKCVNGKWKPHIAVYDLQEVVTSSKLSPDAKRKITEEIERRSKL